MTSLQTDPVVSTTIGAAIEVHRCLGPGLLEGVYQTCLAYELVQHGLQVEKEVAVPVMFKGIRMDCGFRLDFLVDRGVIIEVKSVEQLIPVHTAQVLTYLRLAKARQALLMNFNEVTLIEGLKSFLGDGDIGSH
jgi:GxxExxY protein